MLATLKADAARQLHFGSPGTQVGGLGLMRAALAPRFAPVVLCRLATSSARVGLRPLGKLFSLVNFVVFGLEIGLDCEIGPGLYLPHTSGTVIGAAYIGKNAVIYHQVTLGAKRPDLAFDRSTRPVLGDDVFIGSGAKVLGPVTIGDGATVGANAVVTASVPAGTTVVGIPARPVGRSEAEVRVS